MNIFIDDERNPNFHISEEYQIFRSYESFLESYTYKDLCDPNIQIVYLSLDHDMGENKMNGYEFLKNLEKYIYWNNVYLAVDINIHSQNPVGKANMERALQSMDKARFLEYEE